MSTPSKRQQARLLLDRVRDGLVDATEREITNALIELGDIGPRVSLEVLAAKREHSRGAYGH